MLLTNETMPFSTVFEKLELESTLKDIFKSTTVNNIKILKHKHKIEISLASKTTISRDHIKVLENKLCTLIPGIKKAEIILILPKEDINLLTSKEIHGKIAAAWDQVLEIGRASCRERV